jgi:hypothetical protein
MRNSKPERIEDLEPQMNTDQAKDKTLRFLSVFICVDLWFTFFSSPAWFHFFEQRA